ncbi:MAG TPA: hypothetical protein VFV37_00605 [Luteibaculaceae bacterium]|nr:hypothetical protein [Luteibaculaceae bacterium]
MKKGIESALFSILFEGKPTDSTVKQLTASHPKWGSRDRKLVIGAVYDMVRYWLTFCAALEISSKQTASIETAVSNYLHPAPAFLHRLTDFTAAPVQQAESFPDWLVGEMGHEANSIMRELNQPARLSIRVNTLKVTPSQVEQWFTAQGISFEKHPQHAELILLDKNTKIDQTQPYRDGWIEVQDPGSIAIGKMVNPKPGSIVFDTCAGAGGKSLLLAQMMHNQGQIICADVHQWKLDELNKRAKRAGISICSAQAIKDVSDLDRWQKSADFVLIDAPCSGTGVIKRKPETKYHLNPTRLNELIHLQSQILKSYSLLSKKGGEIVYATCSILAKENELQIEDFLKSDHNFELVEQQTLLPSRFNDGFFMAKLKRIN